VVGCAYRDGEEARERSEDLVAVHVHPAHRCCRKPNQRRPSGGWTRSRGESGGSAHARTGSWRSRRRRRRRGAARPPTHTHQQHRRWQAAGEAGRRLLPRARSLALEFNSPDPLAPTQLTFSVSATVCSVLNLIQMVIFIR
jgi:hypothetical protein